MWGEIISAGVANWEDGVRNVGWLHLLLALGYGGVAWACVVCGYAARASGEPGDAWFLGAALLVVLGANTLLRLDQLVLLVARETATQQGWYLDRRTLQSVVVGMGAFAGLLLVSWLRTRLDAVWFYCGWSVLGMCLLAGLLVTRGVSFHYTDLLLEFRLAGLSAGRALELVGLSLVLVGTRRWLQVH